MVQNSSGSVPGSSNARKPSKVEIATCKFAISRGGRFSIYEYADEFELSYSSARQRLKRHRENQSCISMSSEIQDPSRPKKDTVYLHPQKICDCVVQTRGGMGTRSVPSDAARFSPTGQLQVTQLDLSETMYIPWLPDGFHLTRDHLDLVNFSWLAKYIELHGGKFEVLTDYYPRYKDTHQISSLACNKHSKATVEVYKGKVLISMGPSKQDGKYGFSPRGTSLKKFAREVVNFMANNIPDLDLENFARHPMWYIIAGDLTFDDPRVSECLDRGPIPIEYGPYKLQANEYMVLRFDDHPWADDPQYNFANGQWCRRQEIRFLNKASFEVAEVVQDLMSRQVEDIQSGAAILSLVNRYESAMDHFDESLKRQELSAQELVFRSNKLLEYLDNLGYDLDFIKEQNAENILLSLLQRRDIDELGTNLEKKLLTGSGMIAGVADAVGNKMDRVGDLLERMLYQNEEAQTTRLENQELLIRQLGTMEEISQLLKEQKKEHFKWRSVDLGTKLTIIATLHQKLGSYEKVAKEINKEFEVSRQALDKLVRKYSSNNHGTNLENLGTKEKSGNFVKTGYLKPSDVPGDLNINENPGTISSPQLSGNFWRTGMKILEVLEGKELSKKAIYKLVGGNTSAFYNIINQMVEAGTLQERPDPGHKQRRLVSIRGEKA